MTRAMAKKRKAGKAIPARAAVQFPPVVVRLAALALVVLFLAHVAVFGGRVMLAERNLSPDSFNYVTVARNLSEGRGFVQSAPGFNQPGFWGEQFSPDFPARVRSTHSVLYPSLIFAVAELTGLAHADAAFLISGLAYAAVLALVFLTALRIWGVGAGLLAVAVVAASPPGIDWLQTEWLFTWAWTEPVAVVLLLGTTTLLVKNPNRRMFLAAGVLAGLAILQRNAMAPLAGLGVLAVLLQPQDRLKMVGFFLAGTSVAVLRPLAGEGVVYSVNAPAIFGVGELLSQYFSAAGFPLLILCALAVAATRREKKRKAGPPFESGEILLLAWIAGYSAFVVAVASIITFTGADDPRIMYPMKIAAATVGAGLAWRALPAGRGRMMLACGAFALATAGGIARDAQVLMRGDDVSDRARIAGSALLRWMDSNLGGRDLVIGTDVMHLPHYFPRLESALSISPYPFSPVVTEGRIDAVVRFRCGRFDNFYFVVKKEQHPRAFGPDIERFYAKAPMPNAVMIADLPDGIVHRLTHCD